MSLSLKIIEPAYTNNSKALIRPIAELTQEGHHIQFNPIENLDILSTHERAGQLENALLQNDLRGILCARGGYGASDLLTLVDWNKIKKQANFKWFVGFSDISALHAAIYKFLAWPTLHAPMPATSYWKNLSTPSVCELLEWLNGSKQHGRLTVEPLQAQSLHAAGTLFGGCFSVLTNLISTPYMPNLQGSILFFEEIGESPQRILRMWNQWVHSGALEGVQAIIWGSFSELSSAILDEKQLKKELCKRASIPGYHCNDFGHQNKNTPIVIGAQASLSANSLDFKCASPL